MVDLTPKKARIFRITHIENIAWILENGLHCKSSPVQDPSFVQIGNPDLIAKRVTRTIPPPHGGTLDDYVPFYFTPHSPMLYNIATGWNGIQRRPMNDIVVLASSLHSLADNGVQFVFSDRHAYLEVAEFSNELASLAGALDWKILRDRDFKRNPSDPGKFERYQAEALAAFHVPVAALTGIVCHGTQRKEFLRDLVHNASVDLEIASRPSWFF